MRTHGPGAVGIVACLRMSRFEARRLSPPRDNSGRPGASWPVKLIVLGLAMFVLWWQAMTSPTGEAESTLAASHDASSRPIQLAAAHTPVDPSDAHARETAPATEKTAVSPPPRPDVMAAVQPAIPAPDPRAPRRQGPIAELSQRFASQSRGPHSDEDEARVRAVFAEPDVPSTLFEQVECRQNVCRLAMRWHPDRHSAYVLALTRAVGELAVPVGIEGAGLIEADGLYPLVTYFGLGRAAPSP